MGATKLHTRVLWIQFISKEQKKIIGKLSKISYPANNFRYVNTVCMKQYQSRIQIQNAHTNSSKQSYEFGI